MIKVLVFSPSFRMRAMIVGMVTCSDVEVESVTSRQALFRRCSEKLFDKVIIEDYRLFMNGSDAVRRIKIHCACSPRIMVLSPIMDERIVLALLDCGVDEYILLPLSPTRLRHKVCGR